LPNRAAASLPSCVHRDGIQPQDFGFDLLEVAIDDFGDLLVPVDHRLIDLVNRWPTVPIVEVYAEW
jgi:hypothetical protein